MAFSRDGRLLLTAGDDKRVKLWATGSGGGATAWACAKTL